MLQKTVVSFIYATQRQKASFSVLVDCHETFCFVSFLLADGGKEKMHTNQVFPSCPNLRQVKTDEMAEKTGLGSF